MFSFAFVKPWIYLRRGKIDSSKSVEVSQSEKRNTHCND